jgi:hypothetical protein
MVARHLSGEIDLNACRTLNNQSGSAEQPALYSAATSLTASCRRPAGAAWPARLQAVDNRVVVRSELASQLVGAQASEMPLRPACAHLPHLVGGQASLLRGSEHGYGARAGELVAVTTGFTTHNARRVALTRTDAYIDRYGLSMKCSAVWRPSPIPRRAGASTSCESDRASGRRRPQSRSVQLRRSDVFGYRTTVDMGTEVFPEAPR